MEEPVWLFPRQMPQLAPLFSRRALATSRDEKVVTTLDAGLQRQLEDLALNWKSRLPPRSSLAMVVVDHTDMKVRGWVGSADITDDSRFGHIDMVSAVRSPGSVLKPFIYAMAMDEGLIHPASLLQDVPRRFSDYRPGNFDSGFHGPVSASEALVRSLNLPAVQVLEAYGPKRFAANLRNAGLPLTLPAGAEPNLSLISAARRGAAGRYCRGVQRLRPPWQGGAAAPEAERSIDRARADVARGGMDRPAYFGRRSATGSRCLAAAGGAAGVENRHQLRLSRRVGGRPQCAISDRHLDRAPGRYAGGGPVWLRQRRAAAQPVNNLLLARPAMSRGGLPSDPRPATVSRGQSAGTAGRICRRATATRRRRPPAGFWMPASRRLCCCRGRRAYAGSASRCGAMNTANGWRRIVPALGKAESKSGRCRWIPAAGQRKAARAHGTGIGVMPAVTDSGYRAAGAVRHP